MTGRGANHHPLRGKGMVHVSSALPESILSLLVSSGHCSQPCAPPAFPGDRQARSAIPGFCFRLCRAGPYDRQSPSCLLCGRGQTFQGLLLGVEDARLLQERGCWPLTPREPCLSVSMLPHRSRLPRGGDPRPRTTASLVPMVWGQTLAEGPHTASETSAFCFHVLTTGKMTRAPVWQASGASGRVGDGGDRVEDRSQRGFCISTLSGYGVTEMMGMNYCKPPWPERVPRALVRRMSVP